MENFALLAFLSPLVLFYQQIKGFITNVFNTLIRNDIIYSSTISIATLDYLLQYYKHINLGRSLFTSQYLFDNSKNQWKFIIFRYVPKYIFFTKYYVPFFVNIENKNLRIVYIYGLNLERILYHCSEKENERYDYLNIKNKFSIQLIQADDDGSYKKPSKNSGTDSADLISSNLDSAYLFPDLSHKHIGLPVGYNINNLTATNSKLSVSKYYESAEYQKVFKHIKFWSENKEWYEKKNISWKRSILLCGQPGTGKSAIIKHVGETLNIPIVILNLANMSNYDFSKHTNNLMLHTEGRIIVFEDIDCIFEGRENKTKNEFDYVMTFEVFINKLSGIDEIKNCFIFMTANNIEKLDPALTRDGRVDDIIEVGNLDSAGKQFIAESILDDAKLIEKIVNEDDETAALFENRCIKMALENRWAQNNKEEK